MSTGTTVIDARFCNEEKCVGGEVQVAALPRLRESVALPDGSARFEVVSTRVDGKPAVRVQVSGLVMLECQRCLLPMSFKFESRRALVFADPPADPDDEGEDADFVGADVRLDAMELLEEEVLLCLPMIPRHPSGECPAEPPAAQSGGKPSPFAALKVVRRN
jgi:uncharacterized protein